MGLVNRKWKNRQVPRSQDRNRKTLEHEDHDSADSNWIARKNIKAV